MFWGNPGLLDKWQFFLEHLPSILDNLNKKNGDNDPIFWDNPQSWHTNPKFEVNYLKSGIVNTNFEITLNL